MAMNYLLLHISFDSHTDKETFRTTIMNVCIREHGSVLYLRMAMEILNLP